MALRPNYISLFAGAGGLELAVRLALPAARCVCYVEREVEAASILAARIADKALDDAPIWSDVSTFDGKPFRGLVDGIVGGFPCQDLSVAGKRAGIQRGNRSGLFYEYVRIIREVEPRWVYIENVPAVLAFPAGGIVLGELAALGFDAEWGSLRASDVRASHGRHRKFILAYRAGERCECGPWYRRVCKKDGGESESDSQSCMCCPTMADRNPARQPQLCGLLSAQRRRTGDGCEDVGNPPLLGRNAARLESGQYGPEEPARRSGSELVVTFSERRCGRAAGSEDAEDARISSEVLGAFAPGPAHPIWNDVLVRDYGMRPALSQAEAESCLRRVADGLASPLDQRIDRLRACGNGVVAVQGAVALRELIRRAGGGLR